MLLFLYFALVLWLWLVELMIPFYVLCLVVLQVDSNVRCEMILSLVLSWKVLLIKLMLVVKEVKGY